MKNNLLLTSILLLCVYLIACSKSNGKSAPVVGSSVSFSANDSFINFPLGTVFIQDVYNVHTTLITGQFADSSSKKGSLSIRLIGDTTGRYHGDSIQVTYINATGAIWINTKDTSNFVQINTFAKTANGHVNGGFNCKVFNGKDSILLSNGTLIALYQD
ncbi:MAG TPA: hypothetical protein VE035_12445 [Puia sp.]|nr:hypothetical protein [Puia sp.]